MAQFIKHVGVNGNQKKVVIVFREVPGDSDSALVIATEALPQLFHDDLMKAIQNPNCQDMMDPSEFLFRQVFNDGTNMLNTIHQRGWMTKVSAKSIMMTPKPGVSINLVELNRQLKDIANSRAATGTRSTDISSNVPAGKASAIPPGTPAGVITDDILANKYRAQAATFDSEAQRLREEADKLDPKGPGVAASVSQTPQAVVVKKGRGRPSTKVQVL